MSAEVKPCEYCKMLHMPEAIVGCCECPGFPDAEPAVANYLTFDVTVSVTCMFVGSATYMGDPKTD